MGQPKKTEIKPYLQVNSISIELRLYEISAQRRIRHGHYEVRIGERWVKFEAGEPHIQTSGTPIRAVDFIGNGEEAKQLLDLKTYLLSQEQLLQMRDNTGVSFEVKFNTKRIRSWLYVSGTLLSEEAKEEFQCQFERLSGKQMIGVAHETSTLERQKGREHVLSVTELDDESKMNLIDAVCQGEKILLQKIPWVS